MYPNPFTSKTILPGESEIKRKARRSGSPPSRLVSSQQPQATLTTERRRRTTYRTDPLQANENEPGQPSRPPLAPPFILSSTTHLLIRTPLAVVRPVLRNTTLAVLAFARIGRVGSVADRPEKPDRPVSSSSPPPLLPFLPPVEDSREPLRAQQLILSNFAV